MNLGITPLAVGLVLLSAVFHAGWNTLSKRAPDSLAFVLLLCMTAPLWTVGPAVAIVLAGHRPEPLSYLMALVTSGLWIGYYGYLGRSYERGDLSVAYPVIRGVSPLGAMALGLAVGERVTPLGLLGVLLIVVAVWFISATQGNPLRSGRALWPPVIVGLVSAAYSLTDKLGVAGCHPVVYITLCSGLTGLWLALLCLWRGAWPRLRETARTQRNMLLVCSLCNVGAYLLVLAAFRLANVAYVVPLRAVAVLFSVLAGGLALGEPALRSRLAWGLVMLAGMTLIALTG